MLSLEKIDDIQSLWARGWGAKRIARRIQVSKNTVKRYAHLCAPPRQQRPKARRLDDATRLEAIRLFQTEAEGNASVVRRLLRDRLEVSVTIRTVQRLVAPVRQASRASELATVRFETDPGEQMQIDFGRRSVWLGGQQQTVYLFVAVLSYSRRIFVRASLSQRQDEWREGLAEAFQHFGGVPRTLLIDNDGALVLGRDRDTGTVRVHPAFQAFCRDWGVLVRACQPYRARTKGKTESGVGFVKKNAIAGIHFDSFAHLELSLRTWMAEVDTRIHGTTFERPVDRFVQFEQAALRPLPAQPLAVRERRLARRVANDCLVDVDTVRYSVPHHLVKSEVDVAVGQTEVRIWHAEVLVATHRRSRKPHDRVIDPEHYRGLWRRPATDQVTVHVPLLAPSSLSQYGRTLADYAAVVGGAP